ncbi:MAG: cytochrome c biogenesis protein CcsA [Saprospiraceae bacterium]
MQIKKFIKSIYNTVFSTRAAGLYLLIFAISIGVATFIENDFGTSSAQKLIFRARWFELLLVLFGGTIIANIIRFQLLKQRKWASLCFHSAIVIIIAGAGVTRYFGYEGVMHIREGGSSNSFLSSESFLKFKVLLDGKTYSFEEPVYFSSLGENKFEQVYVIGSNQIDVKLKTFIPNPVEKIVQTSGGTPIIKVVVAGQGGREEYFIKQGDQVSINGVNFNFSEEVMPDAFNIFIKNDSLLFSTDVPVVQTVMATQTTDTISAGGSHLLRLRSMYNRNRSGFVIGDYKPSATVTFESESKKMKNESSAGLLMSIARNGNTREVLFTGHKGEEGQPKMVDFDNLQMSISYGAKQVKVPFSLQLRDFIVERYPGTENPSSYASEVTLIDAGKGVNRPFRIYMNNILDYGGYRFFQSSFDQDEQGTYLSVNFDFWGTWISYIGYILLTLGMAMTFFSKNSRFSALIGKLKQYQHEATVLLVFFLSTGYGSFVCAQGYIPTVDISKEHASKFGKLLVQDHNGRIKPVNTLSSEILRKIARKESLFDMTSDQIYLSMMKSPDKWEDVPFIHVGENAEIQRLIGTTEALISYRKFFDTDGQYLIRDQVRQAQTMNPKDQGTFEKAILKLDEKVNIVSMVFSGRLLKIFPVPDDPSNTWVSPADVNEMKMQDIEIIGQFETFSAYLHALEHSRSSGDYTDADGLLEKITSVQVQKGGSIIPSASKIKAELLLNQFNIFGNLRNVYGILSIALLLMFFYSVFKIRSNSARNARLIFYFICLLFLFQTIGLGLRWYVSGRAPWSNGYESMIYISWTTVLAGLFFSRKSLGGMAATAVLAATILLVASMSWLDPEITPLVPVLKSYWLTIHVSLEAGSYGFLMLGAVIGMLNLILMVLTTKGNQSDIHRTIKELTIISEITLLGGLFMVSIGTYLGGVWANESWGRYWGWDAKETWALVTILVYAFILHMRFIPGLQSIFAFNFASLFGFATVIMTYFGVNYYLSGLHSYAAGDPVPIPPAVYYTASVLTLLSIVSYVSYRKWYLKS